VGLIPRGKTSFPLHWISDLTMNGKIPFTLHWLSDLTTRGKTSFHPHRLSYLTMKGKTPLILHWLSDLITRGKTSFPLHWLSDRIMKGKTSLIVHRLTNTSTTDVTQATNAVYQVNLGYPIPHQSPSSLLHLFQKRTSGISCMGILQARRPNQSQHSRYAHLRQMTCITDSILCRVLTL